MEATVTYGNPQGAPVPESPPTPVQAAIKELSGQRPVKEFKLADGRTLKVQEPKGSVQWRAAAMLPADKAGNSTLVSIVQSLLYVTSIDGVAQTCMTYNEAQAIADRLGDEGLTMLSIELAEMFPVSEGLKDRLKKMSEVRGL
jgi:hypothetical protein